MGGPPKAIVCYICGRQYMLHSFGIHEPQCRELFVKREELKPPKERRKCPDNPFNNRGSGVGGGGGGGRMSRGDLDAMNAAAQDSYNTGALVPCAYCGRTFLPEKLPIHNKSCTAAKPARRVGGAAASASTRGGGAGGGGGYDNGGSSSYDDDYDNDKYGYGGGGGASRKSAGASRMAGRQAGSSLPRIDTPPRQRENTGKTNVFRNNSDYGDDDDDPYSQPAQSSMKRGQSTKGKFGGGGGGGGGGLAGKGGYDTSAYDAPPVVPAMLNQCPTCGRSFNDEAYSKHMRVCEKVFASKRKTYDMSKHRAQGTDLEDFSGAGKKKKGKGARAAPAAAPSSSSGGGGGGGNDNWRAKSNAFRDAMKAAKQVSMAEAESKRTGVPLHKLLPPPTSSYSEPSGPPPGYIQCPSCGRSFSQQAGERHIPQCKNIINKPKALTRGSGGLAYATNPGPQVVRRPSASNAGVRKSSFSNTGGAGGGYGGGYGASGGGGGGGGGGYGGSRPGSSAVGRASGSRLGSSQGLPGVGGGSRRVVQGGSTVHGRTSAGNMGRSW